MSFVIYDSDRKIVDESNDTPKETPSDVEAQIPYEMPSDELQIVEIEPTPNKEVNYQPYMDEIGNVREKIKKNDLPN